MKEAAADIKQSHQQYAGSFFKPLSGVNNIADTAEHTGKNLSNFQRSTNKKSFFSPSLIQKKDAGNKTATDASPAENYISTLNGGTPLGSEKHFFESRMGYDFSNVRIHDNSGANSSAKNIHALAYTNGNNIVFGANQYKPQTTEGKKLLAHELTHVVQQQSAACSSIQKQPTPPLHANPYDDNDLEENPYNLANLLAHEQVLTDRVMEPLQRMDGTGFIVRLRTLTPEETGILLLSENFRHTIEARFNGNGLWSIFSILFSNLHLQSSPIILLSLALHDRNAQQVTDMLSIVNFNPVYNSVFTEVMHIVLPQIFQGNPLLQQMNDILDGRAQRSEAEINVREAHYEDTAAGGSKVSYASSHSTVSLRTAPQEMRVISKLHFVDSSIRHDTFYFLGPYEQILQSWLQSIQSVWNNRFLLTNGVNTLRLVFVPVVVNDTSVQNIEVHTDNSETCSGMLQAGRANSGCWFTGRDPNTAAHEFGHLIGASDEYELPATAAEIPADVAAHLTAEDISLSTTQGIGGTTHVGNHGGLSANDSLMSNEHISQNVYLRHIQRLVNAINSQLQPGTPAYIAIETH